MDDIKIAKAIEKDLEMEEISEISEMINQEEGKAKEEPSNQDGKAIVISILVIVGIFALAFGGFQTYNGITAATILNVDDLHQENVNGDLNDDEGYLYNGFSFVLVDGLWWTEVSRENKLTKIPLHFGPRDVEQIKITGELGPEFNDKPIHIAIDPTINYDKYYTLALMEMNNNIVQGTKNEIITACNQEHEVCEDRPIVSCDNTQGKAVIELVVAEEAGIELRDTCMLVKGSEYDLVKAIDRLLLNWYGIMD
jgi:hypothetical protein